MNSGEDINSQANNTPIKENKEKEKTYKILYSSYGYIKILEDDLNDNKLQNYRFIQYKENNMNNYFIGSIYKENIKDHINLRIKHFSGKRKTVLIEKIDINSKLGVLVEKLFIDNDNKDINKENLDNIKKEYTKNSQFRLYSCSKGLRELNTGYTIIENNLKDNELLLFFNEIPLTFSPTIKGKSIQLSQMNKTALKTVTDEKQYALGNCGYISGKHYFEINLLTEPMIRSIVIGLAKVEDINASSVKIQKFYGFILSDMKKVLITFGKDHREDTEDYGEICTINDKIGVLFESKNDGIYISFYRNKKFLGVAFSKLPNNHKYYPTLEMGLCGSKVQIYNDIDFPDGI